MSGRGGTGVLLAAVLLAGWAAPGRAWGQSFSFAHASDDHCQPAARVTIAEFENPQPVVLEPFQVTAPPVSFVIDTGDVTEFGGRAAFKRYQGFWAKVKVPHYIALGNHDCTWRSLAPEVTRLFGAPYYSFDRFGCHFVVLNSAGFQHPLPAFGPEQLRWLARDLAKAGRDVPVFVALHHPPGTAEFASPHDVDRLLDVLRSHHIVAILYGHGHTASAGKHEEFDIVQGGSTYGPGPAGYQVCAVTDGVLRIAYKEQGQPTATKAMLEKPLAPPAQRRPRVAIDSPRAGATFRGQLPVKARLESGDGAVKEAFAEVDGAGRVALAPAAGGRWFAGAVPLDGLSPGAHSIKLTFTGRDGDAWRRSTFFYTASDTPIVRWRVLMDTASKTTPTIGGGRVFVGGYDGSVRAYDARSGKLRWQVRTGGAIAGQILWQGGRVYAGSEDGMLYCLDAASGAVRWKFQAEEPIHSAPAGDGERVCFGCRSGAFYGLDAATGSQLWKNAEPNNNIEVRPFLWGGKACFGAWDTFLYCIDCADGGLVWKHVGQGSSHGPAAAYYSPADCGPVVCNGVLFAPDRKYECSLSEAATGNVTSHLTGVAGVGLAADGAAVYLRRTRGRLDKVDAAGKLLWSAEVPTGAVPTAPTEAGGAVYVCSNHGMLSALSAADGKLRWQYQCTPSLYVLGGVGASGSTAWVVGTDGSLTALGE